MEFGYVLSYPVKIGELEALYGDTIQKDAFIFDEDQANATLHAEFQGLTSDAAIYEQIQHDCSLDNLFFDGECTTLEEVLRVLPVTKDGEASLKTVDTLRPVVQNLKPRTQLSTAIKRISRPFVELSYRNSVDESPEATSILRDTFVTVCVYRPQSAGQVDMITRFDKMVMTQQIVMLASQTLSSLRDAIKCPQDKVWLGDCSLALDDHELHIAADKLYKSSYFFIEGVFYDDFRDGTQHSLSKPMVDWINTRKEYSCYHPVKSVSIESVTLASLTVCIGKPYLFLHQGCCEHIFFISDVRLVDREACQRLSAFPMLTGRVIIRSLLCSACKRLNTQWLVSNTRNLLPVNPCPLCDVCLRMLMYDENGSKIFDEFTVHKYLGDEVML